MLSTHLFRIEYLVSYRPQHSLIFRAHILTRSHDRNGIRQIDGLVGIRHLAARNGIFFFLFAMFEELCEVIVCPPSVVSQMLAAHLLLTLCPRST